MNIFTFVDAVLFSAAIAIWTTEWRIRRVRKKYQRHADAQFSAGWLNAIEVLKRLHVLPPEFTVELTSNRTVKITPCDQKTADDKFLKGLKIRPD